MQNKIITQVCHDLFDPHPVKWPRFDKTHTSHARATAIPAFICYDVAFVTYVTPCRNFPKRIPHMHFYLKQSY